MSFFQDTTLRDIVGNLNRISHFGEALMVQPIKLVGEEFFGTTIDPNIYTTTPVGSGTAVQTNALMTLATGTTANSSISVQSATIARFLNASENRFLANLAFGDTGTANNIRTLGPQVGGTDGAYFKLDGSGVLSVATKYAGTETAIPSTSWSGSQTVPTLTNFNGYEIVYSASEVDFILNGALAHTAKFPTSPWTSSLHLALTLTNTNSGGSTTNVSMQCRATTIIRLGPPDSQPRYTRITTAATQICKYGPGKLHAITISSPSGGSATITVYDNVTGSGATIGVVNLPSGASAVTLYYGVLFQNGLTVVSTGTWDATVIYE